MHWKYQLKKTLHRMAKQLRGSSVHAYYGYLQSHQFLSTEDNKNAQELLLQEFLQTANRNIPYYRERFQEIDLIRPDGSVDLSRFSSFSPLTRGEIQSGLGRNESLCLPKGLRGAGSLRTLSTSGTTGTLVEVKMDETAWDWYNAHTRLFYQWMGLELGMPYIYFWGTPRDFYRKQGDFLNYLWMDVIQHRTILDCRFLSEEQMVRHLSRINQLSDHQHLVAYTNELYDLACFSMAEKIPVTRPLQGISVTTARLTEAMRETLQKVFHAPVFSRYGSREFGDLACECQFQQGFHINPFYAYVEVVDEAGVPVPPGEEGRVLVTGFRNRMMPLIRYEIGDTGILKAPGSCPCGRNWQTLQRITGRLYERLILPDGSTLGNSFINYALEGMAEVRHYQIHKTTANTLEVHLLSPVPDYVEKHAEQLARVHHRLLNLTHHLMRITFRQVETMHKAPSGKQPMFVSHVEEPKRPQRFTDPVNTY